MKILKDLITVMKIMGDLNNNQVQDKTQYIIGYSHTKSFIDYYFSHLALIYNGFANSFKKKPNVPKTILKGKENIDDYGDDEILSQPGGVVF